MTRLATKIAVAADAAISHDLALPVYLAARGLMAWTLPTAIVTVFLSDFANVALILMANAGRRRAIKQEREIDELTRVHPDIDDTAIKAECE